MARPSRGKNTALARVLSPTHPNPRLARVTPNWTADMNTLGSSIKRRTAAAARLPAFASDEMRDRRTLASEYSLATKNGFDRNRIRTTHNLSRSQPAELSITG